MSTLKAYFQRVIGNMTQLLRQWIPLQVDFVMKIY